MMSTRATDAGHAAASFDVCPPAFSALLSDGELSRHRSESFTCWLIRVAFLSTTRASQNERDELTGKGTR